MLISEIYYSIQGEGLLTGVPSAFVRTSGCNLRCRWCDTRFSSWEREGEELTVDQVLQAVSQYPTRFCVLTGGEPMITKEFHELASRLVQLRKHVTIETAATVGPDGVPCSLASLSPKMSNSTPGAEASPEWRERHEATRLQHDVIRRWIDGYDVQLKFVICRGEDIDEVVSLLEELGRDVPPECVLLMPEGVHTSRLDAQSATIADACKEYGFRYCDRLHIRLSGNERRT